MKHNDVYVDDAELVVIDASGVVISPQGPQPQPQAQPEPQPQSAVVNSAPAPTALPRPDGAQVHVVKAGDTIFGLSLQYQVPMDDILQLNGLTKESLIRIGQELVISAAPVTTPTPEPAADGSQPAAAAPTATSLPATAVAMKEPSGKTQLCVRAFHDVNADGVMNSAEDLLGDTLFDIATETGKVVVSYSSDGQSEPHCFTRLSPGNYLVSIEPAAGAQPTSDERWSVTLDQGTTATVNFGSRFTDNKSSSASEGGSAIGLVLAAIVLGGGFVIYRQRRGTHAA
jgi:LysM repeat protein